MDESSTQTIVDVLIAEVRANPFLYDKDHDDFRSKKQRNDAWAKIARVVGASGKQTNYIYCLFPFFNKIFTPGIENIF